MTAFSSLNLSKEFLTNLDSLGYKEMTPIQEKSIPLVIEGKDVRAQAKTGREKPLHLVLVYLISLIQKVILPSH